MWAISINDDSKPFGYHLYNGFKTNEDGSATLMTDGLLIKMTVSRQDAFCVKGCFYLTPEFATLEMLRIMDVLVNNKQPAVVMNVKSFEDIKRDCLNW